MSETRTMAKDARTEAARRGADHGGDAKGATGKKKLLVVLAVMLLLGGGAAWYLLLGPGSKSAEAVEPEPEVELGSVISVDPISINLADKHYLKLGLGLQVVAEVEEEPDGAKALDAAISLYSGRSMDELADPVRRDALKEELTVSLQKAYHDEVVDVYFTEFVMQ